jgi:Uma2 family endonuclease
MNNPSFREKLESQIESAEGNIEIFDGFIVRCMPESNRKMFISSVFAGRYGGWARQQGGKFGVGNGGITLGDTMRAPDGTFYRAGNIPPSNTRAHMLMQTQAADWILETEVEHSRATAETKILTHWLANGVLEAWLLVIPNPNIDVGPPPAFSPPVQLPIVPMTQVRPAVPYIAVYCSATHPGPLPNPPNPLQGYFAIDWHSEFQPPAWSLLSGAPPINCDCFMEELC